MRTRTGSSEIPPRRPRLHAAPSTCMFWVGGSGWRSGPDWEAVRLLQCFWLGWRRNHWAPQGGAQVPGSCRGSSSCVCNRFTQTNTVLVICPDAHSGFTASQEVNTSHLLAAEQREQGFEPGWSNTGAGADNKMWSNQFFNMNSRYSGK